jgi:hypothetical protein
MKYEWRVYRNQNLHENWSKFIPVPGQGLQCSIYSLEKKGVMDLVLEPLDFQTYTGKQKFDGWRNGCSVCVETGDFIGASTDSDVYVALFGTERVCSLLNMCAGDKGHTGLLEIGMNDPTVFDVGSVDSFILRVGKDLGDIKKIHIVKAEGGLKDDWYVNKVTISRVGFVAGTGNSTSGRNLAGKRRFLDV